MVLGRAKIDFNGPGKDHAFPAGACQSGMSRWLFLFGAKAIWTVPCWKSAYTRNLARHPANAGFRALRILALLGAPDAPLLAAYPAWRQGRVQEFLPKAQPAEFFPGADRFGPRSGRSAARSRLPGRPPARLRLPELRFHQRHRLFRQADQPAGRHRPERRHHRRSSSSTTRNPSSSSAFPSAASSMR